MNSYTCTGRHLDRCPNWRSKDAYDDGLSDNGCMGICEECDGWYEDDECWYCDECDALIYRRVSYDDCGCGSYTESYQTDWSERGSHNKVYQNCSHGYSYSHPQTDIMECSSTYPCQNGHTSLSTVRHYYCTEHKYAGTSSSCPGVSLHPTPNPATLCVGQSQQLTPNQTPAEALVTYQVADLNIASVSSTGEITGKTVGSTTITVTATL